LSLAASLLLVGVKVWRMRRLNKSRSIQLGKNQRQLEVAKNSWLGKSHHGT